MTDGKGETADKGTTPEGPIRLRLERKGSTVSAAYRMESQDWVKLPRSVGIRWWGDPLEVGVAAVNTATAPLTVPSPSRSPSRAARSSGRGLESEGHGEKN